MASFNTNTYKNDALKRRDKLDESIDFVGMNLEICSYFFFVFDSCAVFVVKDQKQIMILLKGKLIVYMSLCKVWLLLRA